MVPSLKTGGCGHTFSHQSHTFTMALVLLFGLLMKTIPFYKLLQLNETFLFTVIVTH